MHSVSEHPSPRFAKLICITHKILCKDTNVLLRSQGLLFPLNSGPVLHSDLLIWVFQQEKMDAKIILLSMVNIVIYRIQPWQVSHTEVNKIIYFSVSGADLVLETPM